MFRKGDEPIPGYRLEKFLGKGQFGEVWRTTAPGGTSAALKFIDLGGKQGIKEFRGVKRVKEIRHANLMPITALWMLDAEGNTLSNQAIESYDPDLPSSRDTLMVSETTVTSRPEWLVVAMLLGKKNLVDRLNECVAEGKQGIPADELLRYMEEAAKGVDYLNTPQHDLGEGIVAIQHCDIKPANIMLIGDAAVVCDFGLARVLSDTAATATGMVGSPAYMAPENILRKPGLGSDQYALAVSYVELRTSQLPFKELTYVEVLEANRLAKLDLSRLPPAEQAVIRKATALRPEDRYPSALAMVHALRGAVEGTTPPARSSARPVLATAAVFLAIVLPLGVWLVINPPGRSTIGTGTNGTGTNGTGSNGTGSNGTGSNGTGSNGTGKLPAAAMSYTLTFDPPSATVVLNGAAQELSDLGTLSVPLPLGGILSIDATGPDGYIPLRRQFNLEELQQAEFCIRLERDGAYYADRAFERLRNGDFEGAVEDYRQAVRVDPNLEKPQPIRLSQHTAAVQSLAISPNGKWLVSAGDDHLACLWSLSDPGEHSAPIILRGHTKPIECIAISPDSRWLVTGSWDYTAIVWDLEAPDPAASGRKLEGHGGDILAAAFDPAVPSRWIITAGDETVRLWPIANGVPGTKPTVLEGHESAIDNIRVSADGHWLVTIDSDGAAYRWDLSSSEPEHSRFSLNKVPHRRNVLQLTPDGKWLITGDEKGGVNIHALDGKTLARRYPCSADSRELESLAIDPTGRHLLVGDVRGNLFRFALADDGQATNLTNLGAHLDVCVALAISADGSFCVTGSYDSTGRLWAFAPPAPTTYLTLEGQSGQVNAVAISSDRKWIATATSGGPVLLWDAPRCQLILRATGGDLPRATAPLPTTAIRAIPARNLAPTASVLVGT